MYDELYLALELADGDPQTKLIVFTGTLFHYRLVAGSSVVSTTCLWIYIHSFECEFEF